MSRWQKDVCGSRSHLTPIDASGSWSAAAPSQRCKSARPSVVPEPIISTPSPAASQAQDDDAGIFERIIIPSDSEGDEPEIGEELEQNEATTLGDAGDEGLDTIWEEPGQSEQPGMAALGEMTEVVGDEGPNTTLGEALEETGGMGFEVAPPEEAINMALVSS
ncbi:hypothetical protein AMTR_s00042p00150080 [Amborella trichopoda]|uniref:Uncharacterized protein n=1 Tax=Amborella trichopoda TaxID=13333 RepID=W1P7M0_AMBTC|nr:hypothetical protein AMTR_s00042p00150080 [Amborella trichopoda]